MNEAPAPRMSVVLVCDRFATIHRVLASLRRQTTPRLLELVIVTESDELSDQLHDLDMFAAVRIARVESIHPMSAARAAGVRAAGAPIVFIGETHSFPAPSFAQHMIAAHDDRCDAVVPGLANANPNTAYSWSAFLMDYGAWSSALPPGMVAGAPSWNVAYRRTALLDLGSALDHVLSHGDDLAVELRARRHRTRFQPAATLDHANLTTGRVWIEQRFLTGRLMGASRKKRLATLPWLIHICASPLVPFLILWRLRRPVRLLAAHGALPRGTRPLMIVGAVARTAGEVVGYLFGQSARCQPRMDEFELHKLRFTELAP